MTKIYKFEIGYNPRTMEEIYQRIEGVYTGPVFEEIGRELSLKLKNDKPARYPSKEGLERSLILS